mgnify:FL=1
MSTRKAARLVKFEVKKNNEKVVIWAEVPKRAFTEGKVKPGYYISFTDDEFWKILSAKRLSVFNKPREDERIYASVSFKTGD